MRFNVLSIFIVLCMLVLCAASPAKKQKTPVCAQDCGEKYDPVCAKAKNSSKERLITFGSDCVMANYNCQHADDPFEQKTRGECGGSVAVRLS